MLHVTPWEGKGTRNGSERSLSKSDISYIINRNENKKLGKFNVLAQAPRKLISTADRNLSSWVSELGGTSTNKSSIGLKGYQQ